MERIKAGMAPPPRELKGLRLGLPQPKPSARVVLEMKAPAVGVGSADDPGGRRMLLRDVDLVLERGEKVALVGPNGAGKTTLVETVAGLRSVAGGRRPPRSQRARRLLLAAGPRARRGQHHARRRCCPSSATTRSRRVACWAASSSTPTRCEKQVAVLSGGERSRLRLLRLLVGDANFLLLDEPTNHLDVASVEALADALDDYTGTVLLVTHDRHLIDRVATRVLEIHDGRLLNHLSPARYWEARQARREGRRSRARHRAAGRGRGATGSGTQAAPRGRPRAAKGPRRPAAPDGAAKTRLSARRGAAAAGPPARRRGRRAARREAARRDRRRARRAGHVRRTATLLNRLLDERGSVDGQLQREYAAWARLVDERAEDGDAMRRSSA